MLIEDKIREEKVYNERFNTTTQNEKSFDPLGFFSRQNMVNINKIFLYFKIKNIYEFIFFL